ncbi:alpha/beta hydrolase [Corynebacterium heidelbergense]|uniref:alpha/beta hydrolase n=1 Tax=Corynebacterium heidelbergense TaxID=2055947 RepID=UPI001EE6EAB4|nr:alpha/beta hydrolase [Corynebacterium heidelbergense]
MTSSLEPAAEHTPESIFVHSRGVRLHLTVQGPRNAPLLLLIHGFGGGAFEWQELLEQLRGAHYRIAAVDLRGTGRSDKTPRGYDLTTAASDMAGVIRGLGYTRAIVVGHGYGGLVGWTLAAHEPARVSCLVTLSAPHPVVQAQKILTQPVAHWSQLWPNLYVQLPKAPEKTLLKDSAAAAERYFRARVAPGFRDTELYRRHAELRRSAMLVDKVAHTSCEYRRWTFRSRFRPEGISFDRSFPRRIAIPVVCVNGSMDPAYTAAAARRSAQRGGPGSRAELLYGVGHFPHIEDPQAVAEILQRAVAAADAD